MEEYADTLDARVKAIDPQAFTIVMGHVGDGNLHPSVYHEHTPDKHDEFEKLVYDLTGEFGGSISAEHGIGILEAALPENEPDRGGNRNHAHAQARARPQEHSEPGANFYDVKTFWAVKPGRTLATALTP